MTSENLLLPFYIYLISMYTVFTVCQEFPSLYKYSEGTWVKQLTLDFGPGYEVRI